MKKRLLSGLLLLAMLLSLLPVTALAEDGAEQAPACICETACTQEARNPDCPVCGADGAQLHDCALYEDAQEPEAEEEEPLKDEPQEEEEPAEEEEKEEEEPSEEEPSEEEEEPSDEEEEPSEEGEEPSEEEKEEPSEEEEASSEEEEESSEDEEPEAAPDNGIVLLAAGEHTHCICGGVTAGDHTNHSDVTYTAWNGTSGITYTNNTAYVYLTGDAARSSHLTVDGKTLYLCLNGKTLSSSTQKSKIQVKNGGRLVLCDCQGGGTIKGATKEVWGGGCVYLYTSTFDMFGGKLTGGKVTKGGGGGAIALDDPQCVFNMYGGEISGNDGNKAGGAIFRTFGSGVNQPGGTFNMYGGTIKDNKAQNGGAFYSVTAGTVNLEGGTISGNQSTSTTNNDYSGGGAIYLRGGGTLTISGTRITGNSAKKDGGAIFTGCRNFTISGNATITGNTAGRRGGAVCLYSDSGLDAKLSMTGGTISGNSATNDGGGVYVGKRCTLTLDGSAAFTGNNAKWGGAIYLTDNSSLTMTNGELTQNNASEQGGAVFSYSDSSSSSLSGGTIENNTAGKNGGAVYINKGTLKISGSPVVKDNTVSSSANNVYLPSGKTLTIDGAMTDGASIGVTTGNTNYPVVFSNAYEMDYKDYFSSDAGKTINYNNDKKLEIGKDAAHEHTGGTATCTEQATCTKCGEKYGALDPNNHAGGKEVKNAKAATCTEGGYTGDTYCKGCDAKLTTGTVIDKLGHTGGTATCTKKAVCEVCQQEYGELAEHEWQDATCAAPKTCKNCAATAGEKDPANHVGGTELRNQKDATCTEDGYTGDTYCKGCDAKLTTGTVIDKLGHTGGTATCTKKAVCEVCQQEYGELAEHEWQDATCAAPKTCKNCAATAGEKDPANHVGGTELRNQKDATCTEDGYTGDTYCKGCDAVLRAGNVIPAPGHDYGEWTSNDDGTHQRVCSRDASHIEKEACADTDKDHKCDVCGKVLSECADTDNDHNCDTCGKKLTDHTFTAEKTDEKYLKSAATCTEQAVYFKSCAICGEKGTETFASGAVDSDNHAEGCELTWTITDQTHKRAYSRCGKVVVSEEDHEFGDWTVTKKPTSSKKGEKERTCADCGYVQTKSIPARGSSGSSSSYCTLTFESNGGSEIESVHAARHTRIDLTSAKYEPVRRGYIFTGWYEDKALTKKLTSIELMGSRTVYAGWQEDTMRFDDVRRGDWFYDDVAYVYANGLMSGMSAYRFSPDLSTTRAMIVTILWRLEGEPVVNFAMRFADVSPDKWYGEAIRWAAASGIVNGYSETAFGPNDNITREQLAAMLYRYAQYKKADVSVGEDTNILSFDDAFDVSEYAVPAMQWACGAGVMQGANGKLLPTAEATRAQTAAMLHRFCEDVLK